MFGLAAKSLITDIKKKSERVERPFEDTSTIDFSQRFGQAFPGVRGVAWFESEDDIRERLQRLLDPPIADGAIYWLRYSNSDISNFAHLEGRNYLMDETELNIARIAAVYHPSYFKQFVYVECNPMPPTGVDPRAQEWIAQVQRGEGNWNYHWEEYGIVDGRHLVTRGEWDDGAAKIEGKLQDIRGRGALRLRYLTRYNFVIAANGSPINNPDFDDALEQLLDGILSGASSVEDLAGVASRLPRRRY